MIIPIALSLNSAFVKQATVTMFSALQNAAEGAQYQFCLLTYNLTKKDIKFINDKLSSLTALAGIEVIFLTQENYDSIPKLVNKRPKENMFRVLIPQLLPNVPKLIYLDCDILVLGDLSELFDINLEEKAYAAFNEKDLFHFTRPPANIGAKKLYNFFYQLGFNLHEENNYVNSGVLVINNHYWQQHNYTQRALSFLHEFNGKGLVNSDQDALNYLALQDGPSSRAYFSLHYNFLCYLLPMLSFDITDITNFNTHIFYKSFGLENEMKENYIPKLVHFGGRFAPWRGIINTQFTKLYLSYAAKIGWHIDPPDSFRAKLNRLTLKKVLKNIMPYGLVLLKGKRKR
ncbi:MAG: glycosyltransferase family 8 protein [Spirochaetaceae bacterium]|nr:glycosyltransferase family 8 protein [Spirochaetaceae bacterium]